MPRQHPPFSSEVRDALEAALASSLRRDTYSSGDPERLQSCVHVYVSVTRLLAVP